MRGKIMKFFKVSYTWRRLLWGLLIGSALGLLVMSFVPFETRLHIFPYTSQGIWIVMIVLSIIIIPLVSLIRRNIK
jgi:hypothetical protein